MATYDYSRVVNEAGMDTISTSARTRASTTNPLGVNWIDGIGTPTSLAPGATVTITAAQLLTGVIVVAANTGGTTATLDTAANLVAGVNTNTAGAVVGDYVCCLIVNGAGAANTLTLAAGSGGSFDTNQAAGSRVISQNASKWVMIRLTNVTPGSEAYVIYS